LFFPISLTFSPIPLIFLSDLTTLSGRWTIRFEKGDFTPLFISISYLVFLNFNFLTGAELFGFVCGSDIIPAFDDGIAPSRLKNV